MVVLVDVVEVVHVVKVVAVVIVEEVLLDLVVGARPVVSRCHACHECHESAASTNRKWGRRRFDVIISVINTDNGQIQIISTTTQRRGD